MVSKESCEQIQNLSYGLYDTYGLYICHNTITKRQYSTKDIRFKAARVHLRFFINVDNQF